MVAAAEGSATVFHVKKDSDSHCPALVFGANMQSANTYANVEGGSGPWAKTEAMLKQLFMDGGVSGEAALDRLSAPLACSLAGSCPHASHACNFKCCLSQQQ